MMMILLRYCAVVSLWAAVLGSAQMLRRQDNDDEKKQTIQVDAGIACATLQHYSNITCESDQPPTLLVSEVLLDPGSACFFDPYTSNGLVYSVKDQYCDVVKNEFYQSLYLGNKECKGLAIPQKFTKGDCIYGYMLESCVLGPCASTI